MISETRGRDGGHSACKKNRIIRNDGIPNASDTFQAVPEYKYYQSAP